MQENKIFEALLDVIPFAAYAVDIKSYEVVYANKLMTESMYAPREESCWKKIFGQEQACSWCSIPKLEKRKARYTSDKLIGSFFDEVTDSWLQTYDELVRWPDGRTVKYSISVDITEQKEIQAKMIKTHAKLAIQTKKLKQANQKLNLMATKDALTGINNRGYFFQLAKKIWQQQLEKEQKLFVAMLDLDKFKSINDNYGHPLGDQVLKEFTLSVSSNLSDHDIFGRIGGEEFALIMLADNDSEIADKLEKIRSDIASLYITKDDQQIRFTVSIGLVEKTDDISLDMLLDQADKKLYEAKNMGRNRIVFRQ